MGLARLSIDYLETGTNPGGGGGTPAVEVPYTQDFTGATAWPAEWATTGTATATSGTGRLTTAATADTAATAYLTGMPDTADVDITVDYTTPAALGVHYIYVGARSNGTLVGARPQTGYWVELFPSTSAGYVGLRRAAGDGSAITLAADVAYTFAASTAYHLRFQAIGSTVRARIWTGGTEPSTWTVTATDTAFASGRAFLAVNTGSVATARTAIFDNYSIAVGVISGGGGGGGTPTDPTLVDLFAQHVGFGDPRIANVEVRTVTTNANSGAGSLREAVAGNTPKWVKFASNMTITLSTILNVGANTVIDGRGKTIIIDGGGNSALFQLQSVWKVTITHLTLRNAGVFGGNGTEDCIIMFSSDDVWVHHCDLSRASDKLIGIQVGCVGITASWNHFHDQSQTFQIGSASGGDVVDAPQTVTIHHNFFDRCGYRQPVVSYGKAHSYNNYYYDWENYGARAQRIGQLLFEGNACLGIRDAKITNFDTPGDGWNDTHTILDDRDGYVRLNANATLAGSIPLVFKQNLPGNVFTAPYAYTLEVANQALADRIVAGVGP